MALIDATTAKQVIDLRGPDGNAYVLLKTADRLCRQLGLDADEVRADMTRGDYKHLVRTFNGLFGHLFDILVPESLEGELDH